MNLLFVVGGSLSSHDGHSFSSSVVLEGFRAITDLTARLTWGELSLEERVMNGTMKVIFVVDAVNVRRQLNISLEPDGLFIELLPTPMGYTAKTIHIGSHVVIDKALEMKIQEVLTIITLEVKISPKVDVESLEINGEAASFLIEDVGNATIVKLPTSLIVDLDRSVYVVAQGKDFSVNLTIRQGLMEKAVDITAEAYGNVTELYVKASPFKVLATQYIEIPVNCLNVTGTIENFKTLEVIFRRGEENIQKQQQQEEVTQPSLTESLVKYKSLILLIALTSLCFAMILGTRALSALSLILFILYFMLAWGWGGGI
jgi:hypothetical protein